MPAPGQACKQVRQLFLLTAYSKMPVLLVVPPSSMKYAKKYFFSLLSNDVPYHAVVTNITLGIAKSTKGIPYSTMQLAYGGKLSPDLVEAAATWKETLEGLVREMVDVDYQSTVDPDEEAAK